jgi:hypothetical protein
VKTLFRINQDKTVESMGELPRGAVGLAWSSFRKKVVFTESGTGLVMEQGEEDGELIQLTRTGKSFPRGICFTSNGNHFYLEHGNDSQLCKVRMGDFFESNLTKKAVAKRGSSSDADLKTNGICYDSISGGCFVASERTNQILFFKSDKKSSIIGSREKGFASGMRGESCLLDSPSGVAFHGTKKILYVSDTGNNVIREFAYGSKSFTPKRICGRPGESGDQDGIPSWARFSAPTDLTLSVTSLFVADGAAIRKIDLESLEVSTEHVSEGTVLSLACSPEWCLCQLTRNSCDIPHIMK